jgi:1,4-alpha-glucan branching enzyme
MIDLSEVGAHVAFPAGQDATARFGVYLPGITFDKGYRVKVKVIHEIDQFRRQVPPREIDLNWHAGSPLDLWDATLPLSATAGGGDHFGQPGRYLYRFELGGRLSPLTFRDPFARESGLGTLAAFRVEPGRPPFGWTDGAFRVPEVDRMVVYELNVGEFNQDFAGVVAQLDYLLGLGVTVLELMPVTDVKEQVEWGYTPLGYYTPDDRYGGPDGLRTLVDACHASGIAVILDAVYAHAHPEFAYNRVYDVTGEPNPMMGTFAGEYFPDRPGTDFRKEFTRDYFRTANACWLQDYHVDGFRYDYVPGTYDGPVGDGYARLVFDTYRMSQGVPRFDAGGPQSRSRIIQCGEHLDDPRGILRDTYSAAVWQDGLLNAAESAAKGGSLTALAHQLDPELIGFPRAFTNPATGESLPVAPFQYLESHDHSRFITRIAPGETEVDLLELPLGDRNQLFRMQPYVIALYTAKGIPMLWAGQEFGENWNVPKSGSARILFARPLHWEYFYDPPGKALVRLHRIMGRLRRELRCLDSRGSFYYFDEHSHRERGVIAFHRHADAAGGAPQQDVLVLINTWNDPATVSLPWPRAGTWQELIDGAGALQPSVVVGALGDLVEVTVPSNYGAVYLWSEA